MQVPPGCRFSVEERPPVEDRDTLNQALTDHNKMFLADAAFARLAVFLRDATGPVRAGLDASTYSDWMFVNNLWVHAELRGQGVGRELMARAEQRAAALGCHSAYLDTFSFQAPGFYQKLGYTVFGTLDYPPDHKRFFLQKRLQPSAG